MKNKTLLLTFVLILFSAVLYAQPQKKINFTDSLGRKQGYWKKIVNDTLKYEGTFKPFREYAKQHNLLVTYGSDWHGGIFGRAMLSDNGENVLSERLARALKLEGGK